MSPSEGTAMIKQWKDDVTEMRWDAFAWDEVVPEEPLKVMKQLKLGIYRKNDNAVVQLIGSMAAGADSPVLAHLRARVDKAWGMVEARLGEAPFLAGSEFSAADIITLFPLTTMRLFSPRDLANYPNIADYLQTIGERPAFQRAMAAADPGFTVPLT